MKTKTQTKPGEITVRVIVTDRQTEALCFDGSTGMHLLCLFVTDAARAAAHAEGYALTNGHSVAASKRFAALAVEILADNEKAEIRFATMHADGSTGYSMNR